MTRDNRQPLASRGACLAIAVAILLSCGEGQGRRSRGAPESKVEPPSPAVLGAPASCRLSPDCDFTESADHQASSGLSLEQAQALAVDESAPASKRSRALRELSGYLASQGQLREAVAKSEAAVELLAAEPSDGGELATALNELSGLHFQLGDYQRQEEVLWRALDLAAATSDRASAASSWNNLGVSYAARGRPSAALAAYQHCLELRRDLADRVGVAATRHNLGVQLLLLGRVDEGVDELRQAVAVRRGLESPSAVGRSLASLAWGLALGGQDTAALTAYAEAVSLLEAVGAAYDLAVALEQRAKFHRARGRLTEAHRDLERSFELLEQAGGTSPVDVAYLRLGLGAVRREQGDVRIAEVVEVLQAAVEAFDDLGMQDGRIMARLELARALRAGVADWNEAVRQLEAAISIVESARSDLQLPSFRATFLGGWQAVYQELVDLLASAAIEASPAEAGALAARALEVAERGRARALLDRLAAADRAPAGSQSWQGIQDEVEELEARALFEPAAGGEDGTRGRGESVAEARSALRRTRFALKRMQEASLRAGQPTPAAMPAGFDSIRRHLGADTVLLVYSLAPGSSWLWRVDLETVRVLPLSPGPEIEAAARKVHQLLPLHHKLGYGKAAREALARLAQLLLAPVSDDLEPDRDGAGRPSRFAIVPDGALHLVPFGALPVGEGGVPLSAGHEVVHLPSASTLVALRRRASRVPASRLLAVVADPVFEAGDPRLGDGASAADRPAVARTRQALGGRLGRLLATAEEGARIADVARRVSGVAPPVHLGFDASRELVTGGGLADYVILHFATHGVVDAEDPALAGLVLSLYDASGRPRDGLLRARDLHGLRLGADLVVLSACRTALGEEVRGEGLVGLAGGFFAAGAGHLIVSLWDVDDRATAELMTRFYRHLLLGGLGPAGALRQAQRELREQTEWGSPAYWAAFVGVGDWAALPLSREGVRGGWERGPGGEGSGSRPKSRSLQRR